MIKSVDETRELLRRVKSGDQQAFRQLFDAYYALLYRHIDRNCHNPSLADDLAQETFFRVWLKRHTLKPRKPFFPFIAKIARNLLLDHYKKQKTQTKYQDRVNEVTTQRVNTPEDVLTAGDLSRRIRACVERRLSHGNQIVFYLSRSEGLSNGEVASLLGISRKSVENHLYIALRTIKEELSCI